MWNSITCVILHRVPNNNLIFPKINSKILYPQFSNFTSLHAHYIVSHHRRTSPSPGGGLYFFNETTSKLFSFSSKPLSPSSLTQSLSCICMHTHKIINSTAWNNLLILICPGQGVITDLTTITGSVGQHQCSLGLNSNLLAATTIFITQFSSECYIWSVHA